MTVSAVMLFGSRARGDNTAASDTDLLMMTEDRAAPRHAVVAGISLSFYAQSDFVRRAEEGDLFVWHVLFEGRPLYDPSNRFEDLRGCFRLRSSYDREIGQGAALAWMLVRFGHRYRSSALAARRATWAVRTILIARSAEQGLPRFAAAELEKLAPLPETTRLIRLKTEGGLSDGAVEDLRRFLVAQRLPNPVPHAPDEEGFRHHFEESGNEVGIGFLQARHADQDYPS